MVKKLITLFGILIGLVSLIFIIRSNGTIAETESTGVDFTVNPIFDSHQKDRSLSYWWLDAKAGETLKIEVAITNSDAENTFQLTSNQAVTNSNFVVDYGQTSSGAKKFLIKDSKNVFDFYHDVTFGAQRSVGKYAIKLKPNETVNIPITIKIPKKGFNGQVVGGINITREPKESERKNGMLNVYNRAFALVIESGKQEDKEEVETSVGKLALDKQSIILKNPTQQLIQSVKLTATIKDKKGKIYSQFENSQSAIVPQADIDVPLFSKKALAKNQSYILDIKTEYLKAKGSKTTDLHYTLDVDKSGSISVLERSDGHSRHRVITCIIVTVIVLALVAIVLGGWMLLNKKVKKRSEKESNEKN